MKRIIISAAVLLFAVVLFTGSVVSSPVAGDEKPHREIMKDKLNLSEEQQNKIDNLRSEHQKKMVDLRASLKKAQIDLQDIRKSEKLSRAEVIASVEKLNELKAGIALERANHRMDVYEVLTPEQQKIWKENKGERHGKGLKGKMRKHMRGGKHLDW